MRWQSVLYVYWLRLRRHWLSELFSALGVAVGVALVFGVLLASSSLTTSAGSLIASVVGKARFALVARSPAGFSEALAERVGSLPGVRVASPLLIEDATLVGPRGRRTVQLIGATASLPILGGSIDQAFGTARPLVEGGIGLPAQVAKELGTRRGGQVEVLARGASSREALRAIFGEREIGGAASAGFAVASLPVAQSLAGRRNVVTQVLVEAQAGARPTVRRELDRLAAGRLDVEPADYETAVLEQAVAPNRRATDVLALVGAVIGLLLSVNAVLLSATERRRWIAGLRMVGFAPRQLLAVILFQAVGLATVASALGLALGSALASYVFSASTGYLDFAFPIGTQQSVTATAVALAVFTGMLATALASLPPLLDLFSRRPLDAPLQRSGASHRELPRRAVTTALALGVVLLALSGGLALIAPAAAVLSAALLAASCLLLVPVALRAGVAALTPWAEHHGASLVIAIVAIRANATRALAVAAIVALSVYGNVTVLGARQDLKKGIDAAITQFGKTTQVWVTGGDNVFTTDGIGDGDRYLRLAGLPTVGSVRRYYGSLLDVRGRRMWVRAREATAPAQIEGSQIVAGDARRVQALLRGEGWVVISDRLASEERLGVGSLMVLPTPLGDARLRVAALSTNSGWPPGAITLSAKDYKRYWRTSEPSGLEVEPAAGATMHVTLAQLRHALGDDPAVSVQREPVREAQARKNADQGLQSLEQIGVLLLVAAALAVGLSLAASIWQRRPELATLKTYGFNHRLLWRALLSEAALLLVVGASDGVLVGTAGQVVAGRYLRAATGFPVHFSVEWPVIGIAVGLIVAVCALVVALPGYAAALVDQHVAYGE